MSGEKDNSKKLPLPDESRRKGKEKLSLAGPEIDQRDRNELQVGAFEVKYAKENNSQLSAKLKRSAKDSTTEKFQRNALHDVPEIVDESDHHRMQVGAYEVKISDSKLSKKMSNQPSSSNSSQKDEKIKLSSSGPEIDNRDMDNLRAGAFAEPYIQSPSLDSKMSNQPSSSNSSQKDEKIKLSSSGPEIDTTSMDELRRQQEKQRDPITVADKSLNTNNNDTIVENKEVDPDQILDAEVKEMTPEMKETFEQKRKSPDDDAKISIWQSFSRRQKLFSGLTLLVIIIIITVVVIIIVTQNKNGGTSPTTMPVPSPAPVVTNTPTVAFTPPPTNIIDYPIGPPTTSTSSWTPIGTTKYGSNVNDRFGRFLSMNYNGTIIATVATGFDDGIKTQIGSVQLFQLQTNATTTDWIPQGRTLMGTSQGDQFGSSCTLSGDGNVVAIRSSLNGTIKIFHYQQISGNTTTERDWVPKGQDLVGHKNGDDFGNSLSIDEYGNVLLIGAQDYTSNDGISKIGMAIAYQYDTQSDRWKQMGDAIYGDSELDMTGSSVSISASGTRIAIGDLNNDCCGVNNGGRVRIFDLDKTKNWILSGSLSGTAAFEKMGYCSLSGNGLIVTVGSPSIGKIQVYENLAYGTWKQLGQDIQEEDNYIGAIVSLSYDGRRLAYGAPINDSYKGYTNVLQYNTTTLVWEQVGKMLTGSKESVNFGSSIALSANGYRLAVGAEYDFDTGSVTVYEY